MSIVVGGVARASNALAANATLTSFNLTANNVEGSLSVATPEIVVVTIPIALAVEVKEFS